MEPPEAFYRSILAVHGIRSGDEETGSTSEPQLGAAAGVDLAVAEAFGVVRVLKGPTKKPEFMELSTSAKTVAPDPGIRVPDELKTDSKCDD